MKTKIIYELDKTKDEDLEYANLLDIMIASINIIKTRNPEDVPPFEYNIVDNTETMVSEYTFEMEMDITSGLLQTDEMKRILSNFIGGL
jgi:hypothetical protein